MLGITALHEKKKEAVYIEVLLIRMHHKYVIAFQLSSYRSMM